MSTTPASTTIDPLWRRALRPLVGKDRRHQVLRALGLKKAKSSVPAKGADAAVRWSRIIMVREMQRMVREIHPENLSALEIAGEDWKTFGFAKFRRTFYPEYDICTGPVPGGETFDIVIANQVFEHLLWPYRAARHVHEMLKPGGYFLIAVPFLVRVHNYPVDCSRWTELGLKHFLAEAGFPLDQIQAGSWGNRACVVANLSSFLTGFDPQRHSLENEPDVPYHVWALARKAVAA